MNLTPNSKLPNRNSKREAGSATVLVFALVVILVAILAGNQSILNSTKRELKLIEQQQLKRLQAQHPNPAHRP